MTDIIVVDVAELTSVDAKFVDLGKVGNRPVSWRRHSALPQNALERAVVRPRLSRYRAAYNAARDSRSAEAIISHLPRMTAAVADLSRIAGSRVPHLAFSFNFTSLPGKLQRVRMVNAFSRVDQFCVYTQFEAGLYADAFDIDPQRFKPVNWTQTTPEVATGVCPQFKSPYVAAVGGEARDFTTLVSVARRLPDLNFVVIARPTAALADAPPNMTILFNIPGPVCWQIAAGAEAVLVPLIGPDTCCGHVTLVSARLLALPIITTASRGTQSYTDGFAGTMVVPHADPDAFAGAILAIRENSAETKAHALADQRRAQLLYDRSIWANYVGDFLKANL